jgi:hypothetical protein
LGTTPIRFQPLDDMADSIPGKRNSMVRVTSWRIAALFCAAFFMRVAQAQPQFGQGFSHAGQVAPANPAESRAYAAAIGQTDPQARASAIQQFLIQYPNSPLRQPAIAQMMLAKRDVHSPGAVPAPMNRTMTPPATAGPSPGAPATAPVITPQPMGAPPDSLLQHPAKPADVAATPGSLFIKADNSSLSQILQQVSKSTGMKVDGLGQDERIFGTYGPGNPREVLLSLLDGSGYNVLMVGDNKGAPRQLSLSQRAAGSTIASAPAHNNREQEDDEIEQEQPQPDPPQPGNPYAVQPRNPAEIQQELMRLRQQEQAPQQPPQ